MSPPDQTTLCSTSNDFNKFWLLISQQTQGAPFKYLLGIELSNTLIQKFGPDLLELLHLENVFACPVLALPSTTLTGLFHKRLKD